MINYKTFVANSRKFLEDYITRNNLKSVVIGVSGGLDSTVSCALASPICKKLGIPLIGRSLPSATNNDDEHSSANACGKAFCTDYKVVTIQGAVVGMQDSLVINEGEMTPLQLGNIKARIRMIYLRHVASIHRGVTLDNDNFTEYYLGFWTIGGDSPMDLNLGLHYLWKTEVYELAKWLHDFDASCASQNALQALEKAINITPTDGNGVSNGDCEQFGLKNYEEVDAVLKELHKAQYGGSLNHEIPQEVMEELYRDYGKEGVDKTIKLHYATSYKRNDFPIMPTKTMLI